MIDRAVEGFRGIIGGWRDDAWPRGLQEEDRDQPWGRGTVQPPLPTTTSLIEPVPRSVKTGHVKPRTRVR